MWVGIGAALVAIHAGFAAASENGFELELLLNTAMTAGAVSELDEPTDLKSLAYTAEAANIGLGRAVRVSETILGDATPGSSGEVHFYRQLPKTVKQEHVTVWLSSNIDGGSKRGKLPTRCEQSRGVHAFRCTGCTVLHIKYTPRCNTLFSQRLN